ncbi:unnamed protein product [Bursaphelenchus xylophilus]|uniref:(pine wood nematode) hypothetical protein n=1 Tax=Bursaphelenchus xylophilus TaxID=6326 RepID=A0A1I7SRH3_BURXY|nr:unnamed protein product [Bursaphelenchus xylophilus]CAG9102396.1 unnamed protein product [Bursaphelenchus xylophilus]
MKRRNSKPPRQRTSFTPAQLEALEERFQVQQYLVGQARIDFAHSLGLNEAQVKVWFQNRRIKWRKAQRQILHEIEQQFTGIAQM